MKVLNGIRVEVCVYSIESALEAQIGGADRIELCDNLYMGGTTPSAGMLELAKELLDLELYAIIRPRGGDFLYTAHEFELMKRDVLMAKKCGLDGVVIGILKKDGTIDKERTSELMALARPMGVTFHRAFDLTPNPYEALEDLTDLKVDRILTSGHARSAFHGIELIADLVAQTNGHISIMPGSGINEENVVEIITRTGAREFHVSARRRVESLMEFRKNNVCIGNPELNEYEIDKVAPERIVAMKQASQVLAKP